MHRFWQESGEQGPPLPALSLTLQQLNHRPVRLIDRGIRVGAGSGIGIGGARGKGLLYEGGQITAEVTLSQLTIGFQWGGQAFSEIIFFQNQWAYDKFTRGQFEFDAKASAVAITAGASAQTSTTGTSASASAGPQTGVQSKAYYTNGMATFVHVKGGLMAELSVGGQKFNFRPL